MTEQIKSRIEKAANHLGSIPFCRLNTKQGESVEMAIRSLQAWDEVLQELENKRDFVGRFIGKDVDTERNSGRFDAYDAVIDIIKQKLSEIEE